MSGIEPAGRDRARPQDHYVSVATSDAITAVLFPGQGSQTSGMAAVTAAQRPDLLELARAELGDDPFERIADGTHFAQPALYCASLAYWKRAGSPPGAMYAGHSLGELAALVAGGALDAEAGLALAIARGQLMEDASKRHPGAMLAVLGGDEEVTRGVAAELGLAIANENAPGQVVLSGDAEAIGDARKRLRAEKIKAIRLPVAGAFHSPLMEPAIEGFRAALERTELALPATPVISSITAVPFEDPRAGLLAALTEPVRWPATIEAIRDRGAAVLLETGPGDILTGLNRRILPGLDSRALADEETVNA